jgi:N-acetylglucosamine-6-phosphate deacetylase
LISFVGDDPDVAQSSHKTIDVSDCYITPGLIDLQVNGGPRCNFWQDPTAQDIRALSDDLLKAGVTTILPTLITDDLQHLIKNIQFLKSMGVGPRLRSEVNPDGIAGASAGINPNKSDTVPRPSEKNSESASNEKNTSGLVRMPGIHLEGPCLSPQRPGVHPAKFIRPLSIDVLDEIADDAVCLMTVAPETDPSGEAIKFLQKKRIVVSLGHSNATFEEAEAAFDSGVKLITHTFNALPAVHHRAPGAVTAALLDDTVTCAIICDGLHVSVPAIKLVLKVKTKNRTVLVTDAAQVGTTSGGLVGSSITLNQAVQNVVKWKLASFADAVLMASWNPAKVLGMQEQLGHIAVGKVADLVVWDKSSLAIRHVFLRGQQII